MGAAASPNETLYRWRQWLRGSSPRMGGRITPGLDPGARHDGVGRGKRAPMGRAVKAARGPPLVIPPLVMPGLDPGTHGRRRPSRRALYRWRRWLRGSSPRMGGRIKSGHDVGGRGSGHPWAPPPLPNRRRARGGVAWVAGSHPDSIRGPAMTWGRKRQHPPLVMPGLDPGTHGRRRLSRLAVVPVAPVVARIKSAHGWPDQVRP